MTAYLLYMIVYINRIRNEWIFSKEFRWNECQKFLHRQVILLH